MKSRQNNAVTMCCTYLQYHQLWIIPSLQRELYSLKVYTVGQREYANILRTRLILGFFLTTFKEKENCEKSESMTGCTSNKTQRKENE